MGDDRRRKHVRMGVHDVRARYLPVVLVKMDVLETFVFFQVEDALGVHLDDTEQLACIEGRKGLYVGPVLDDNLVGAQGPILS